MVADFRGDESGFVPSAGAAVAKHLAGGRHQGYSVGEIAEGINQSAEFDRT